MAGFDQDAMANAAVTGAIRAGASARQIGIQSAAKWRVVLTPGFWLVSLVLLCAVLLLLPVKLAIGGYYWDVYLYPDAAWRIANGQIPSVDFFIPAGALEYYTYALLSAVFPQGQQLLMAQWGLLLVSLPLMAWTLRDLPRENPFLSLAVVLPFVFFSFVPLNTKEVYPLAGVDGYGIYNRHTCLLLYIMVTAFVFVPAGRKLAILTGLIFTALFFTKITGAFIALIIIAQAVLCGRLDRKALALAAGCFAAICVLIEFPTGMVSAYLRDIVTLVGMNAGGLIERLRSPVVMYLDILAPLIILSGLLIWVDRAKLAFLMSQAAGLQFRIRLARLCGHDSIWILVIVAAGILFET